MLPTLPGPTPNVHRRITRSPWSIVPLVQVDWPLWATDQRFQRWRLNALFYVTIIAALLMYLHTGIRPSKYMFALLSQVAVGAATLNDIIPIVRELDHASAARRRTKK